MLKLWNEVQDELEIGDGKVKVSAKVSALKYGEQMEMSRRGNAALKSEDVAEVGNVVLLKCKDIWLKHVKDLKVEETIETEEHPEGEEITLDMVISNAEASDTRLLPIAVWLVNTITDLSGVTKKEADFSGGPSTSDT